MQYEGELLLPRLQHGGRGGDEDAETADLVGADRELHIGGWRVARFGDLFALDKMFACILAIMLIAVVLTEGIRWAERAAFPWRVGQ